MFKWVYFLAVLGICEAAPRELRQDLLDELLNSSQLVVIDVYADWCGPCRKFEPVFKQASETFSRQYVFFKLNGDKERELLKYFHVNAYPTTLYFKQGREVGRHVGGMSMSEFTTELNGLGKKV